MADMVTVQELENAKIDARTIGESVNENKIVTPRYGAPFKSMPMIAEEFQDAINTIVIDDGVPALAVYDSSGKTQQEINDFNKLHTFNTVNVLDYIPKDQHGFIKNNQLSSQDQTIITTGFNMAALYARTYLKEPTFIVPSGEYATNDTVLLDLPNNSNIIFNGVIATSALNKPAVVVGSYNTNRFFYNFSNIAVYHRDMQSNITGDTNRSSVGVLLMNIVASTGNIKRANGFSNGVLMDGSQSNGGSSYNHVTLGYIKDNVYCLRLKMTLPNGYTNENTFYGGSFGHSSAFPFTGSEVDIKVDAGSETQALNNNLFFRPSLESNSIDTKAAILEGNNNQIYMPRIENSKNYGGFSIIFGNTSNTCAVLGLGFGLKNNNIVDNGGNNKFQTSATLSLKSDPASPRSVLELQNTASNVGKVLLAKNTAGTENFTLYGSGTIESTSHGYFQNGLRWLTSSGTNTDKGIFLGANDPNGVTVASVGSLFVNTSNSKVFTKKSGAANTGWIELIELRSGSSAARPSGLSAGYPYFDTTLNKPIWYNGTTWVDANGLTV